MTKRTWLWVALVLCVAALVGFCSCTYTHVNADLDQWGPEVVIVKGSDPVPPELLRRAKVRTNQICQGKGSMGVERVTLFYCAATNSLEVAYRCFGD